MSGSSQPDSRFAQEEGVEDLLRASDAARSSGQHADGARLTDAVLTNERATPWQQARALAGSAWHRIRLGKIDLAIEHAQRSLQLSPQADAGFHSGLHTVLAMAYHEAALFQQALRHVLDALALSRSAQDRHAECWALSRAALMSEALGHARARAYSQETLALARSLGEPEVEFAALNNMASMAVELSADPKAAADFGGVAVVLAEARQHAQAALDLALAQGNLHREAIARGNLSQALLSLGDFDAARRGLYAAIDLATREGYGTLSLENEVDLCRLDALQGHGEAACQRLLALLPQIDPEQDLLLLVKTRTALYEQFKAAQCFEQALEHHEHRLALELRKAEERASLQARVVIHQLELEEARYQVKQSMRAAQFERERAADFDRQANTDPLTGLNNRRHIDTVLPALLRGAQTDNTPLAAVLADIDHFKRVNDGFGHAVGDEVLVEVARLLRSAIRCNDLLARIGGEEFLIILVDAPLVQALEVCERIRAIVQAYPWASVRPGLACSISMGVAKWCPETPFDAWLQASDSALYAAKRNGRNRVVLAEA